MENFGWRRDLGEPAPKYHERSRDQFRERQGLDRASFLDSLWQRRDHDSTARAEVE